VVSTSVDSHCSIRGVVLVVFINVQRGEVLASISLIFKVE
jgi:hypothetical protein